MMRRRRGGHESGEGINDAFNSAGEDVPQFVNNIVYCRDPKILEDKVSCLNLKNLMQHENFLDIKQLIKN